MDKKRRREREELVEKAFHLMSRLSDEQLASALAIALNIPPTR